MSLSARDSAFLTEMGIGPIWTLRDQPAAEPAPSDAPAAATFAPEAPAAPAPIAQAPAAPAPVAPAPASAPVAKAPAAEPAQPEEVGEDAIAAMDWQQLDGAIDTCTRCGLCKNGRKPVHGS
ncbi:MAG: uracil-DNA glycosylase, partial [Massilia sp.]